MRGRRFVRVGSRCIAILIVIPVCVWLTFVSAVAWWPYPSQRDHPAPNSTRIEDRNGISLAAFVSEDGQWRMALTNDQISPHLLNAIVAVEDSRFYQHHGVDWKSVAVAAWQDVSHLSARRGASTLTMQLERLGDPRTRTFTNKIEQAIRAEQLEQREVKQQIIVDYVNAAPFGGNLVGAGAASWRYFGRPCRQLSLGEAALLAGLPQSPNRLRPDRFPKRAMIRRNHVLDRMLACGFISQTQRDEAAAEPINVSWRALPQDRPPDDIPPADGGLPVLLKLVHSQPGRILHTTIDATMQRQTAIAAREHLQSLTSSGISAAAVVVLDTQTSQCLACVSLGSTDVSIDLTGRRRSTGSTLKPFIYAAAFDAGLYGPRSVLLDSPAAWPGYQPNDYDRAFRGNLTAAEALAESRNIPAMLVLAKVGVEPAVGVMDAAGLHGLARSPERYGLSLAIGGAEASPMEIAEAYASLGRGGVTKSVQMFPDDGCVVTNDSPPIPAPSFARYLRKEPCWQVLNAISEPTRTAAVWPEAVRSHVAWKTGTSSGHRDAWCAAVTQRRTVVVWVGNANGQGSPSLVGQDAAAPLALQLIAMFDPKDDAWPLVPDSAQTASSPNGPVGSEVMMVHPIDGEQFVLTADAPRDRQRMLLQATHRGPASELWWFVDGRPLGKGSDSSGFWWMPGAGSHDIRVIDSTGHSAAAHVRVRVPIH
jgi:penicillin-binding protein 1C